MIEAMTNLPTNVVGVKLSGTIEPQDYIDVLDPAIQEALKQTDKVNLIAVFDKGGVDYSAGAMWQDLKVGLTHPFSFHRVAVVMDPSWKERLAPVASALMSGEMKSFSHDEERAAIEWVSASE